MKLYVSIAAFMLLAILSTGLPLSAKENTGGNDEKFPQLDYVPNEDNYVRFGYYVSAHLYGANFNFTKSFGLLGGLRAAYLVDQLFALGAGVTMSFYHPDNLFDNYGGSSSSSLNTGLGQSGRARLIYGGGYISYHIFSLNRVSFSAGAMGGAGYMGRSYFSRPGSVFYFIEPEMMLFIKLAPVVRIGIGASFRYSWHLNYNGIGDNDFKGLSLQFAVQCGEI